MKKQIMLIMLAAGTAGAAAQSEVDALRYSMTQRAASARSLGMGSSFGALGSDISSFFGNPAGIAAYKRGTFELGFDLNNSINNSSYGGQDSENSNTHFRLNNFGIAGTRKPKNPDWVSVNFGIGYAKTNNFFDKISIKGTEFNTSLMDVFAAQASGIAPSALADALPFTSSLAYETYAIDPIGDSLSYVPSSSGGEVIQSKSITRRGAQSETSFGFGANYKDVLLFGMSLNFQNVRFSEESTYRESFDGNETLSNLSFREDLASNGTGVGLKLGFIVKPVGWLRVGGAYHTRTVIGMRETWETSMASTIQATGEQFDVASPDVLITNYNLTTPARYMANAAFILGKSGVIAADYEYADYNNIRMRGTGNNNDYDYNLENNTIGLIYRGTHRVSTGIEWRLKQSYYVRGGAVYQQSPFVNGVAINSPWITYTGGIGYRSDYFFIDLATSYYTKDETYYMYQTSETQPATIQTSKLNFLISAGFRY